MEIRTVAEGLEFPEGPVALADGSVVLVEIAAGTVIRVSPDGIKTVVARPGGGPNGAAIGPDGKCYVCNNGGFEWHVEGGHKRPFLQAKDYAGGRIERINLATGAVECLHRAAGEVALKGPNDLVFDRQGGFYFSDLGKVRAREMDRGAVYYAAADGSRITEVAFPMITPTGSACRVMKRHCMSPRPNRRAYGLSISSSPEWSAKSPGRRRMAGI
jgi:gluconolactonase